MYNYLFNSYYVQIGERFHRPHRGLLSRPTVKEVYAYRAHVDRHVLAVLASADEAALAEINATMLLGFNHEQQHQELMLTDIKHVLSVNPMHPVFREGDHLPGSFDLSANETASNTKDPGLLASAPKTAAPGPTATASKTKDTGLLASAPKTAAHGPTETARNAEPASLNWVSFAEGLFEIGHEGTGFCFDNELPRHREFIPAFQLANRLVTCGEYVQFIEDDGYRRAELWLSDGAAKVESESWRAPLYWEKVDGGWHQFTLSGFREVDPSEPVCHVSCYEADAYARWAGARLPSEAEWEIAASSIPMEGNFVESGVLHPQADGDAWERSAGGSRSMPDDRIASALRQMYGDVWEWTRSPYAPYPGYEPPAGAVGEYNGKFMSNQMVLRGGSCATSRDHIRPSYRNFFPPHARWQFSGIRLAKDLWRNA
jgi:formylglycine-generating enzyme required for sulfatase activity